MAVRINGRTTNKTRGLSKTRVLPAIRERRKDYEALELEILKLLKSHLYIPLLRLLKKPTKLLNSKEDLIEAVIKGHIAYDGVGFTGVFSADVSRELKEMGAVWSKKTMRWLIHRDRLSMDILDAVNLSEASGNILKDKLTDQLASLRPEKIVDKFDVMKLFKIAAGNTDRDFRKTVEGIVIPPKFSDKAKEKIAREYETNLKLYIRNFTEEQILELRQKIKDNTLNGGRYDSLVKDIQTSYGVTQRKAKFLARQETGLLTAKIKEARYAEVGIDDYVWQCVSGTSAHPVRPYHLKLNHTRQKFSDPPVTDAKGNKNNPGCDFNCRCTAKPIVEFKSLKKA